MTKIVSGIVSVKNGMEEYNKPLSIVINPESSLGTHLGVLFESDGGILILRSSGGKINILQTSFAYVQYELNPATSLFTTISADANSNRILKVLLYENHVHVVTVRVENCGL